MIASLPMYNWPQLRAAHDLYWEFIRERLMERGVCAPKELLSNGEGLDIWRDPDLLFSQTCGLPLRKYLSQKVWLVGTPDFDVPDCPPGYYCSYFVVKNGDDRKSLQAYSNAKFAYNSKDSQSGFMAAKEHLRPLGFWFGRSLNSGAHVRSAQAVAEGRADIACIDAVSWRFMKRYNPFSNKLRVLAATRPTPGLPYITSPKNNSDLLFDVVQKALGELPQKTLFDLSIKGLVKIPLADYLAVDDAGYSV